MTGRMESKRGRGSATQKLIDEMMEDRYGEFKEKHNIVKSGVVGYFGPDDLKKKS